MAGLGFSAQHAGQPNATEWKQPVDEMVAEQRRWALFLTTEMWGGQVRERQEIKVHQNSTMIQLDKVACRLQVDLSQLPLTFGDDRI